MVRCLIETFPPHSCYWRSLKIVSHSSLMPPPSTPLKTDKVFVCVCLYVYVFSLFILYLLICCNMFIFVLPSHHNKKKTFTHQTTKATPITLPHPKPTGMTTDSGVGGSVGGNLTSLAITQRLFTPSAHDFVSRALARFPDERPLASDLLNHPFIRQTRKFNSTLPQYLHPVVPLNQQTDIGEGMNVCFGSVLFCFCFYF